MICHICENVTAREYCNVCGSVKIGRNTYAIQSGWPIARARNASCLGQQLTRGFISRARLVDADDTIIDKRLTKSGR